MGFSISIGTARWAQARPAGTWGAFGVAMMAPSP